jgi:uncharacterized protein YqgV (UPF0045/DUF77 family)
MLIEFSIYPLGEPSSLREVSTEVFKVTEVPEIGYSLTTMRTLVEGTRAEVMQWVYPYRPVRRTPRQRCYVYQN